MTRERVPEVDEPRTRSGPLHSNSDARVERTSRRVARNALLLILQPILLNAISLAVSGFVIRTLGPEDFGRLAYALSMKDLFASLAGLGIGAVTVRDLARDHPDPAGYVGRMLTLRLASGLLAYGVLVALTYLGGVLPRARWAVLLAGSAILPVLVTVTIEDVFRAHQQMEHIARVRMVVGLLLTAAQVVALLLGGRLAAMIGIFTAAAYLTMILAGFILVRRFFVPRLGFDPGLTRRALGQGIVFYLGGILGRISSSVDKLVLERVKGVGAVGVFGAGTVILEKLVTLPEGLGAAVYPALAGLVERDRPAARRVLARFVTIAAMVGLPIAVGGTILAGPIVRLLAGEGYPGASRVMAVAIWTLPAWALGYVFSFGLSAIHREREGLKAMALGTGTLVLGNLVLVPILGSLGAAVALTSSQWVSALVFGVMVVRHYGWVWMPSHLARTAVGLGLMAAVVWATRGWPLALPLGLGVVLYGAVVGPAGYVLVRHARSRPGAASGQDG